jgi:thiol-disulfide isomerase/thioredoxin
MPTGGRPGRRSRRRARQRLVEALVGALLVAACSTTTPAAPATSRRDTPGTTVFPVAARQPVPAITGRTLDGKQMSVRDLSGSVVVLNVWASWCTSCREESAALAALAKEMERQPVHFLGIDEQDSPAAARTFLESAGTPYPQLTDPDGDMLTELPLLPQSGIPSTLVLDRHGRMAARVIGPVTQGELRRLISAAGEGA